MRVLYRVLTSHPSDKFGTSLLMEADHLEVAKRGALGLYDYPKREDGQRRSIGGDVQMELVWIFAHGQWSDVRPATAAERKAYEAGLAKHFMQKHEPWANPSV